MSILKKLPIHILAIPRVGKRVFAVSVDLSL